MIERLINWLIDYLQDMCSLVTLKDVLDEIQSGPALRGDCSRI